MTYWTYAEIKAKIENDLDLKEETFITDEELMGYVNEAIDVAEAEIHTIYEDYFLTKANIALTSGVDTYSLPTDIYANKIRAVLYKKNDSIYEVKPIRQFNKFLEIALTNQNNIDDNYRYILINTGATAGVKLQLVPPSKETSSTNIEIWYLRNANKLTGTTSKCDIPEFVNFILAYTRMKCYEKEGHPNLQKAMQDVDAHSQQMTDTLSRMIPDQNNEIESDTSHYEESV